MGKTRTGYFGEYGGIFVPETLIQALENISEGFLKFREDPEFCATHGNLLSNFAGRPTPLTYAERLSKRLGCKVYLKREDLIHGGAHKTNNCLGQGLLAQRMGKTRLIAETGAGQHGSATAMVGALLGIETIIYMGATDIARQASNVNRIRLFGAKLVSVASGSATLKDAINEALRDWISRPDDTYYLFGTVAGPHPFPAIVRHFQAIIGTETRSQVLAAQPDWQNQTIHAFACVGGGSNAIGFFSAFLDDKNVNLYGVEPAGRGLTTGNHGATLCQGSPGVFHGSRTYLLQDPEGQIAETHSIAPGLDYPGVGPEHSFLKDSGRVQYFAIPDEEALEAFQLLSLEEGIIPALESAHAIAGALKQKGLYMPNDMVLINISGRGDKDLDSVAKERPEWF